MTTTSTTTTPPSTSRVQLLEQEVQTDLTGNDLEEIITQQVATPGAPHLITNTSLLHQHMLDSSSIDVSRQSSKNGSMLDSGFASEKLNF